MYFCNHSEQTTPRYRTNAVQESIHTLSIFWAAGKQADSSPMALETKLASFPKPRSQLKTYVGQFGYHNPENGQEIYGKVREVIVGVVSAQQKQNNWYAEKEFLRRRVLSSIVNLFPHIQIIVGAGVKLERHAAYPMEHEK